MNFKWLGPVALLAALWIGDQVRINRPGHKYRLTVAVETPEGPLQLVHWHLGLAERERHWQVGHLLEHPLFRESDGLPVLIVGDFNDWRNTLAHGPFARHGFHQVTSPRSRFRSFPANFPVLSLGPYVEHFLMQAGKVF